MTGNRWRRERRFARPSRQAFGLLVVATILGEVIGFRAVQALRPSSSAVAASDRRAAVLAPEPHGGAPLAHGSTGVFGRGSPPSAAGPPMPPVPAATGAGALWAAAPSEPRTGEASAAIVVPLATETAAPPPTETPLPPPTWTPGPEAELPVLPVIDAAMKARLRAVHQAGLERGLQPAVFAKVGDSISQSTFFLSAFGCGAASLHDHADLAPLIDYFRQVELPDPSPDAPCAVGNAFTRRSIATGVGWSAGQVLAPLREAPADCPPPANTPLGCELRQIRPAIAVVMFGTNEAYQGTSPAAFGSALAAVLDELLTSGVVPILSTIPHQEGYRGRWVPLYNAVIVALAAQRQVPLVNYWRALAELDTPHHGLAPDGIHPSAYAHGGSLGPYGLRFGYNVRNLVTLRALAKVKTVILEDGPAD